MKFRFIDDHQEEWPVRVMCDVLGVSASGYYAWRCRPESARAASNLNLLADVRRLNAQHRGRYGSPRMQAALRAEGRGVSRGRIERLMRRHGIRAAASRRVRPVTTDSHHGLPVAPNLIEQRFVASAPNQVWLADLTYVPTGEGWLYLAAVLDLATRKGGGLGDAGPLAHGTRRGGSPDGEPAPAPWFRAHPSFGSWFAVCCRRIPTASRQSRHEGLDEPDRQLL